MIFYANQSVLLSILTRLWYIVCTNVDVESIGNNDNLPLMYLALLARTYRNVSYEPMHSMAVAILTGESATWKTALLHHIAYCILDYKVGSRLSGRK